MLTCLNTLEQTMTLSSRKATTLTDDEWNEMTALKDAINTNPATVHPEKMAQFTEYLVRSLKEKGG